MSYAYEYGFGEAPGQRLGKFSEEMFFEGEQSALNPMRYLPTPFHTKFAQQRTALSQYIQQESVGTRMRRWERPFHDFLMPYLRGTVERVTGQNVIPAEVRHRRDLDTLTDMRGLLDHVPSRQLYIKNPRAGGREGNHPAKLSSWNLACRCTCRRAFPGR